MWPARGGEAQAVYDRSLDGQRLKAATAPWREQSLRDAKWHEVEAACSRDSGGEDHDNSRGEPLA